MRWTLKNMAAAARGTVVGGRPEAVAGGISTDTRTLTPGEAFVAIRGERFDGHDFVSAAAGKSAACALVDERYREAVAGGTPAVPLIVVPDTVDALGRLAASVRNGSTIPWVGVTGSAGKTTTKELASAALGALGPVLKSPASFNNRIGVPRTVLALEEGHRAAVVEVGTGAPGEIAPLAEVVRPTIAIVTTVGPAHLEGFGDVGAVAREKAELVRTVAPEGVAVLPADSEWLSTLGDAAPGRVVTFGLSEGADVRGEDVAQIEDGTVRFALDGTIVSLRLAGRANVTNALAAIAAAEAAGVSREEAARRIAEVEPAPMRGRLRVGKRLRVYDDCYNANPLSFEAALAAWASVPARGRRWVVAGDMCELGRDSAGLHEELGTRIARTGAEALLAVGEFAEDVARSAREGGLDAGLVEVAGEAHAAARRAVELAREGDLVLVKGSRAVGLEVVVEALVEALAEAPIGDDTPAR
ncbi:MAG: UDP-N-acetylmuramoyl-tripeptide--D-alanyl-D-alanine ligase [Planctomycetota bacterium]|jgi:UDP-N-acetylmuramoyl-tripeptide--D-alanyl-D-alanine ligase